MRGEFAMQDDRRSTQGSRVWSTATEPDADGVHLSHERRLGESILDHAAILLAKFGETRSGERDQVDVERVHQTPHRLGQIISAGTE